MKTKITLIIAIILSSLGTMAQTSIPGGDVYGNWTANGSPYLIEGDITLPADCTLIIDPGVTVEYQGAYKFMVYGIVDCQGTQTDSIIFCSGSYAGHRGMTIMTDTNVLDSIHFAYCRFEDARCSGVWPYNCGGGVAIQDFDRVRIEHCIFENNHAYIGAQAAGGAIAVAGFNGIIRNNSFIDNRSFYGGAMIIWENSNPDISNNYFLNNRASYEGGAIIFWGQCSGPVQNNTFIGNRVNLKGGALCIYNECNPLISHNLFYDNFSFNAGGAAVIQLGSNPVFLNNTFVDNLANTSGGAIRSEDESCPRLINNILWGNMASLGSQFCNDDDECIPDFFNNDIQYGKDSITGFHDLCEWKNNIDAYPEFEDTATGIFNLSWISPCLDIGVDSIYDPDGTISDLGAFWFDQTVGIEDVLTSQNILQLSNYPNPFCENTTIRFRLPDMGYTDVELSVFDISGRRVAVVANEGLSSGEYQLNYNASNLPAGIYIMRLQVGGEVLSRKIVKR
jgi:predicted outer membrane repeat protein